MNNVKTIKQDNLWKLGMGIHCVVNNKRYLYLGRSSVDGLGKYMDVDSGVVMYDDEEELQADELLVDITPDVQGLYEAKLRELLSMVDDGWTVDSKAMNIRSDLEELRTLKMILDIVKSK